MASKQTGWLKLFSILALLPLTAFGAPEVARFAYVANADDNTVSIYAVEAKSGQLRARGYVVAGAAPSAVAVHPNLKLLYVTNARSNNVSAYQIATDGRLTETTRSPFSAGARPASIAIHPGGRYAYVANEGGNSVSMYRIESGGVFVATGTIATGARPRSLAIHPNGRSLYVANYNSPKASVYRISSTGTLVTESTFPTGLGSHTVAIHPSGNFVYVTNTESGYISAYRIEAKGAFTRIAGSPVPVGSLPTAIDIDVEGKFAYVTHSTAVGGVSALTIHPVSGALTLNGSYSAFDQPSAVRIDPSGQRVYVANRRSDNLSAYALNRSTGALSTLSTSAPVFVARNGPTAIAFTKGTALTFRPKFAYAAAGYDSEIYSYLVDPATGALNEIGGSRISISPLHSAGTAVQPGGEFLWVTKWREYSEHLTALAVYKINRTDGTLAEARTIGIGEYAGKPVIEPSGRFIYIPKGGSESTLPSISAYKFNPATGVLSEIPGSPFAIGRSGELVMHPNGRFLYVGHSRAGAPPSGHIAVYAIDPVTGALSEIFGSPFGSAPRYYSYIAVEPSGRFLYVEHGGSARTPGYLSTFEVNSRSGAISEIGSPLEVLYATGMAITPDGRFIYTTNTGLGVCCWASAYQISTGGTPTELHGSPYRAGAYARNPTVDPSGRFLYMAIENMSRPSQVSLHNIGGDGALTRSSFGPFSAGLAPHLAITE